MSDLWRLGLGHELGQGGGGGGIASYLPSLYGSVPIWHAGSTTPNTDGLISAIADVSLSLYPLTQGTGANQPTRGSGVITFADSTDLLDSADATLLAMGDLTAHAAGLFIVFMGPAPAARTIAGWNNAATGNRAEITAASGLLRTRKETTIASATTNVADGVTRSLIVQWDSGAEGDAFAWLNGVLDQTLAVTGSATTAPTSFSIGRAAATMTGMTVKAAAAMGAAPSAQQRAQWDAWAAAGCPL